MFVKTGLRPTGILIHGGDKATHESNTWRVSKRDLVGVLQVLLQNQRLKIAPGPLSDVLASEMLNFKVTINPATAHDSYSAWREAEHDDLVLAVALACWWGQQMPEPSSWLPPANDSELATIGQGYQGPFDADFGLPMPSYSEMLKLLRR